MKKITPPFEHGSEFANLLSNVSKLSYLQKRIFLHKLNKNPHPHFFYRYVSLDVKSDESIEKLRDVIVNSHLWLSSKEGFNDPFDTQAKTVILGNPQQLRNKLNKSYKQLAPDVSGIKRKEAINKLMANQSDMLERVSKAVADSLNKVGACCFTSDPRNLLMWSHYANHHKGIILQFEVAKDTNTFLKTITVDYVEDYPIVNWANETAKEISKAFLNKHKSWKYEDESRIIHPEGANTSLAFKPEALTAVILGCKASQATKDKVKELLVERIDKNISPVKTYSALRHDSKYKIVIKRRI